MLSKIQIIKINNKIEELEAHCKKRISLQEKCNTLVKIDRLQKILASGVIDVC